jgi:hypothetical protein
MAEPMAPAIGSRAARDQGGFQRVGRRARPGSGAQGASHLSSAGRLSLGCGHRRPQASRKPGAGTGALQPPGHLQLDAPERHGADGNAVCQRLEGDTRASVADHDRGT